MLDPSLSLLYCRCHGQQLLMSRALTYAYRAIGCGLLRTLGTYGANQDRIAAKGGVNVLLGVLQLHPKVQASVTRGSKVGSSEASLSAEQSEKLAALTEKALAALRNLAANEANQLLIAQVRLTLSLVGWR